MIKRQVAYACSFTRNDFIISKNFTMITQFIKDNFLSVCSISTLPISMTQFCHFKLLKIDPDL